MTPRDLFREGIDAMEVAFRRLEDQLPRPRVVDQGDEIALRYAEQSIHQAILMKLARYISGLNACDVLLLNGFVQEQGVIQRTLDEANDAIFFLVFGAQDGPTKVHRKYLAAFWQEEFEEGVAPIDNTKGRYIYPSEVRNWVAQRTGEPDDLGAKASRVINQTYSGYVHAAAPHIMDMCGGPELRFYLRGLNGTSRMPAHVHDLWNYVYRGFIAAICVAKSLGDEETVNELYAATARFEEASGSTFMSDAKRDVQARQSLKSEGH